MLFGLLVVIPCIQALSIIRSGGSTFTTDLLTNALADFGQIYSNIQTALYIPSTSSIGMQDVATGKLNFASSSSAVTPALMTNGTNQLVALPTAVGAFVFAYNLPGISTLKLSERVLPRIFDGTINKWNHPLLVADNPDLANNSATLRIIQQQSTASAASILNKYLKALDSLTKFPKTPFGNSSFQIPVAGCITTYSQQDAAVVVGAVVNTLAYLNPHDALSAISRPGSTTNLALVQHPDGSFVAWNENSVRVAFSSLSQAKVDNLNIYNDSLTLYNSPAKGAYPFAVVTNIVIKPANISSDYYTAIGTLKFLWWLIQTPSYADTFQFSSISNSTLGVMSLEYLKNVSFDGIKPVYGQSVCDIDSDGMYRTPCQHGRCEDPLPFQDPRATCICDFGYFNVKNKDCSEPIGVFNPDSISYGELAMFLIGVAIVLWTTLQVYLKREEPDLKAMSPPCCFYILMGCLIGEFGIIIDALSVTQSTCYAKFGILALAFGIVFSMIFFKSFRIFLIFGYSKIARSGLLRDTVMMLASSIIAVIDLIVALFVIKNGQVAPHLVTFTNSFDIYWDCLAPPDYQDQANSMFNGLLVLNGILLFLCIVMAFQTRKAAHKFNESKKVAVVIVMSTLLIGLDLAVNYGIPITSLSTFNVRRIFTSAVVFILCTATPIILFAPALGLAGGTKENMSHGYSSETQSTNHDETDGLTKAYIFHAGLRVNRPTSLWKSAILVIMPDLDMLIILSEGNNGTHSFHKIFLKVQEKTTHAAKAKQEEYLEMTLGDKSNFILELSNKEKMEELRSLRLAATSKKNTAASANITAGSAIPVARNQSIKVTSKGPTSKNSTATQ
ncbi:periplasmic binding protein-like II [Rhizoclosmatium globosum]|uniref:Periplasmic binding protein-like II n=1 Tax=Rhizoclosmatium globosum TaxID=329046 RepID=A0A1Y2CZA8_9FUNG|nr:periplasmic binding protein-like II [Rhizoclosmatium globosum]|eukprot:ORY52287.1 periplasmic binding protein-like II [Rhizoclosmatium globosum]